MKNFFLIILLFSNLFSQTLPDFLSNPLKNNIYLRTASLHLIPSSFFLAHSLVYPGISLITVTKEEYGREFGEVVLINSIEEAIIIKINSDGWVESHETSNSKRIYQYNLDEDGLGKFQIEEFQDGTKINVTKGNIYKDTVQADSYNKNGMFISIFYRFAYRKAMSIETILQDDTVDALKGMSYKKYAKKTSKITKVHLQIFNPTNQYRSNTTHPVVTYDNLRYSINDNYTIQLDDLGYIVEAYQYFAKPNDEGLTHIVYKFNYTKK
jgi:hypothetical protein